MTLYAADGTYTATTSFNWNVTVPVTITAPADQSNNEGDTVSSLAVTATNTSSGTLSYSATGLPSGLSINSSTGVISGTITTGGSFTPTVTATNGTYSASAQFNWTVGSTLSVSTAFAPSYNAGDVVSYSVAVTDTGSGTLSYSASGLPTGLSISSSTGLISGTISSSLSAGNITSTITVTDGTDTTEDTLVWVIAPSGPITVTNPGDQTSTEGGTVSLGTSGTNTGSGTMYFAAQGLPPGLAMNPATGEITGTIGLGDAGFAPYLVTVTATDGTNTDSQSFNWNISSAVTLTAPADQTSSEGASASLSLSATYSGSGSLSYAAFGLPPGLKISASSGDITGTVAVGAAADGPYYVTVVAAAGDSSAEQSFNWTVNSPITLTDPADQTNNEGDTVSLSLSATDATSGTLKYSAIGLPGGLKINPSTGAITGTLAAGDAGDGPYSVTVLAQDGTYSTSQTFNWTVNSAITITTPADQTNNEGDSVSLSISASDATSGATMVYAALGLPPGVVISPTTGTITGTITTGSSANGPYTVTIGVTDSSTFAETSFNWNVNSPITINTPPDQTNNAGDTVSLAISASDAASGTLTFSATGLPSGLSINTSTGAITGTISDGGSYQPTITATDGTYTGSTTFNWSVSSPIAITDQGDQTNNDGDTGVSVQISATDNASGTVSFSASGLPSGLSINSSTGAITGTVGSSADTSSPYTSVITVTDGTNTAIDTFTWYVNPSDPVVVFNPGSQTNADGDMVALPIEASDSTAGATLYYAVSGLPAGLNYNPATGLIFGTISSSADTGSPYTVTVTVGDNTNSASTSFTWTVNTAGTVTMVNPGDQTNSEGDSVSVSVSASDASSGTLHYVAFGLPAGLKINAIGAITGTVAIGDSGESPYTVTLVANDGTYSAEQTFYWNVNSAISIVQPLDQTNNEGDTVSLSISACGGTPSYAVLGLPPGLKINPSTGAITGTIATGSAADGPYSVTILAVDGMNSATMSFNWNVNSPITINVPDTQTNNDGDTGISVAVSATDAASGTVAYSAVGLPPGLSINSSTGAITGGIIVGDSSIGTFEPTIIANDGTYATSASFEWDVNGPISISGPSELSNVVGDTVNMGVVALDTESGTLSYAAAGLPTGLSINSSTGLDHGNRFINRRLHRQLQHNRNGQRWYVQRQYFVHLADLIRRQLDARDPEQPDERGRYNDLDAQPQCLGERHNHVLRGRLAAWHPHQSVERSHHRYHRRK